MNATEQLPANIAEVRAIFSKDNVHDQDDDSCRSVIEFCNQLNRKSEIFLDYSPIATGPFDSAKLSWKKASVGHQTVRNLFFVEQGVKS